MLRATLLATLLALVPASLPVSAEGAESVSFRYVAGGTSPEGQPGCTLPASCGCANLFFGGFRPEVGGNNVVVEGVCSVLRPRAELLTVQVEDATGRPVPFHWMSDGAKGVSGCPRGDGLGAVVDLEVPEVCSRVTVFLGLGATTGILTVS